MIFLIEFLKILNVILSIYFSLAVIYTLTLSIGAFFYKDNSVSFTLTKSKIAIVVPAYKEDSVILHSILEHLSLNYPSDLFHVFLAADSLMEGTLIKLSQLPITVIKVEFEISTVTKSVKSAVFSLNPLEYPITLICDADNILEKNFLNKINSGFQLGMKAIQGRRFTKNLNTPMAVLDSLSEIINNHLFKKGSYALGLSAALIGSGMAFDTKLLQECLIDNHSIGGYDRELHLALSEKRVRIHYLENAVCYDEKVSTHQAFGNQRRRWLSSQFIDLKDHFKKSFQIIFQKGGFNYFQLGFLNNFFLPRVLNLGLLFIISLCNWILFWIWKPLGSLNPIFWFILFLVYLFSLALGVPKSFYNKTLFQALLTLPKTFLVMFFLLFKLKGANKRFLHTEHSILDVEDNISG